MTSHDSETPPETPPESRSTRRTHRRRARTVRRVAYLLLTVGVAGIAWIVVTAFLARSHLEQARTAIDTVVADVRAGKAAATGDPATQLASNAHRAHQLTTGPAWWVAAQVPWVGRPLESARGIASQVDALGREVPAAQDALGHLSLSSLRSAPDTIDVGTISTLAPQIRGLAESLTSASGVVDRLPKGTWLSPVDQARDDLADQLRSVAATARSANTACQVLPQMLGSSGLLRYLVVFQNEAEMRGTGGLPGAFAILTANHGTVRVEKVLTDADMANVHVASSVAPSLKAAWGDAPYYYWLDANDSAHLPTAAAVWSAMWKQFSGETLDGVIGLDPTAVSYLLQATGGGTLPNGVKLDASNVVAYTQSSLYTQYPTVADATGRKQILVAIANLVSDRVLSGTGDAAALLSGLGRAASERRLLVWSADPTVEAVLAPHPIAGVIPDSADPYSHLVIDNGNGGKLDYYLDRAVTVQRRGCGERKAVDVTIRLTNGAPKSGLPPYVADRVYPNTRAQVVGQNRLVVDYIATRGSQLLGATLDGKASGAAIYTETGNHPVFRTILDIRPGQTQTYVLHLTEPGGTAPMTVVEQPGVRPIAVDLDDRSCHS